MTIKIDATLPPIQLNLIPDIAQAAEGLGFDALWGSETMHDPFLPGALVAEHTKRISYGTAVAIAFARSPATMAYTAWDLAQATGGRFILGLGTQVKAHIVRRFGMPWPDSVVSKLRDQINAMRALWNAWQNGGKLDYRGEYYQLTLMTPFFNPGPIKHPDIPIYIAGVNTGLARLAGELADGFVVHPFHTPKYLRDILLPAIQDGAAKSGRETALVKVSVTAFVATTPEENYFTRTQIAFYASTPSYRAVMALHGWDEEADKMSTLARKGGWADMASLVSDEMLETFAVVGPSEELPDRLFARYQGLADRMGLYLPFVPGERDDFWKNLVLVLKR